MHNTNNLFANEVNETGFSIWGTHSNKKPKPWMKLRLKTKGNHDGERIRLKEQTFFLGGLISVQCVPERPTLDWNLIFLIWQLQYRNKQMHRVSMSFYFFGKETFASAKKL